MVSHKPQFFFCFLSNEQVGGTRRIEESSSIKQIEPIVEAFKPVTGATTEIQEPKQVSVVLNQTEEHKVQALDQPVVELESILTSVEGLLENRELNQENLTVLEPETLLNQTSETSELVEPQIEDIIDSIDHTLPELTSQEVSQHDDSSEADNFKKVIVPKFVKGLDEFYSVKLGDTLK